MIKIDLEKAKAHLEEVFASAAMKHMQPTPEGTVTWQMRQNQRVQLINGIIIDLTEIQLPDFDGDKIAKHLPMAIRIGYGECLAWSMTLTDMSHTLAMRGMMEVWKEIAASPEVSDTDHAISWFTRALGEFLLKNEEWVTYYLRGVYCVEEAIPAIRCFSELMEPLPTPSLEAQGH